MHVEEVVHNEPVGSPIVSNQVSNKNINNSSNNIVLFGASILKRINVKNLKSGLYNGNCRCRFFGGATSKHFHHYIPPTLNETDVITDVVVILHMWTKEIINLEVNKDLVGDSIINTARECVAFGVKSVFYFKLDFKHSTQMGF